MPKLYILLLFIIFSSCKSIYTPRNISDINIQKFDRENSSIRAIYSLNKNTLFYAGSKGDIGITKDGGKTWEVKTITYQDSLKPHFRSIAFDGKNILALSITNPALLYSYNLSSKKTELIYKEEHKNVFYDCLKWENNFGIAVGDPIDGKVSILINSNGKWIKKKNVPAMKKGEAFFAASNTNIKIIGNTIWIVSGGKKSRILKSTDKGNTWKIIETPFIQGEEAQGMYSIDFYDENNGIAIGGSYSNPSDNFNNKAITNDGGNTWKIIANNKNPNYKSCVAYVPNTKGKEIFAVGKTGISFSNDAGKTWREVSKDSYYSISFVNRKLAWLSGNGKIGKMILK